MHHAFKLGETEHNLELSRSDCGYRLHLGDRTIPIEFKTGIDGHCLLKIDGRIHELIAATHGDEVFIHLDGETHQLRYEHPLQRLEELGGGSAEDKVRAPMPGSLVVVNVKAGQTVARGETLLIMESMKMETTITAPRDGVVLTVTYGVGQTFDRDAVLLELKSVD